MAIRNLSVGMLRSFVEVNDCGRFSYAANKLGRSQPAISAQIKRLEEVLGRDLMYRRSSSVELTHAGQCLMGYAKKILALNDELFTEFNSGNVKKTFIFRVSHELADFLLPKLLKFFGENYSFINLDFVIDSSKALLANVPGGESIFTLGLVDIKDADKFNTILTSDLVWVAGNDFDHGNFSSIPILFPQNDSFYQDKIKTVIRGNDVVIRSVPDIANLKSTLREGYGVSFMPRCCLEDGLKIIDEQLCLRLPSFDKVCVAMEYDKQSSSDGCEGLQRVVSGFFKTE